MRCRRLGRGPALAALLLALAAAPAAAAELGLGVAAGASFSPTALKAGNVERQGGGHLAGGFFVDIPVGSSLALSPAATLYTLELGSGRTPATDLDLGIKVVLPLSLLRLAAGVGPGITHAGSALFAHLGAQGMLAVNVAEGVDLFLLGHYRHIVRRAGNLEAVQGLLGAMLML